MDPDQFQPTARELLERHIADTSPPKRAIPEADRVPEQEPARPEANSADLAERAGYRYGSMASQQAAALKTNDRVNQEYFEYHASQGSEPRRDARADLEQHIEKAVPEQTDRTTAREALQQHLEGAKQEVTERKIDGIRRDPASLEYER